MIKYIDENNCVKKMKGIRKYFMRTYKDLIFRVYPTISDGKKDGEYEEKILIDERFDKVYGELKLKYFIQNGCAFITNIEPSDMLLALHRGELPIYAGLPYRDKKDLSKIKILEAINEFK